MQPVQCLIEYDTTTVASVHYIALFHSSSEKVEG